MLHSSVYQWFFFFSFNLSRIDSRPARLTAPVDALLSEFSFLSWVVHSLFNSNMYLVLIALRRSAF